MQEFLPPAIYGILLQADLQKQTNKNNPVLLYLSHMAPNEIVKMAWPVSLMLLHNNENSNHQQTEQDSRDAWSLMPFYSF